MDNRTQRPGDPNRPVRRPAVPGQQPRRPAPAGAGGPASQRQGAKRSDSRWFRAILMVMATVVLCVFLAIFVLQSANDLFGLNQPDNQIEIVVPQNTTLNQISFILAKSGVVDKQFTFQIYASLQKIESFKPGNYMFNSNMGYDQILTALKTGSTKKEVVKLTFIEGENVYEIAAKLEKGKVCDAEEFLDYLQTGEIGFDFMDQLPESGLRFHRLEGYLFPDTYEFYVGEKVDSVAKKFLRNFDAKITTNMKNKMMDLGLSLDETITLASVVQKEANNVDEMKRVSSVFHNRMNLKEQFPKLQSDVTKIYVEKFIKPFQSTKDQAMYDAYNTYVRDGLPIGAICNPGMDAIDAVLYPADTPYYFFVTDVQEHFYYSVSAQEHYNNVVLAARVEGEGEIHGTDTE